MALSKKDKRFQSKRVSYIDFKHLAMDRVLTGLFERLWHNGFPARFNRKQELLTKQFIDEIKDHPEWFTNFAQHEGIVARWLETHLLDLVNRGKANEAVAAPRPLHGFTYRFRNKRKSRDYGAAEHVYEVLYGARGASGHNALSHLKNFFFAGHDQVTGRADASATLDVETQALLRLMDQVKSDAPDTNTARDAFPPLCVGSADLFAEDVTRLLCYRDFIPRSVMVDYMQVLMGLHLGLYHLRLLKLLPALIKRKGADPTCGNCPVRASDLVDPQNGCPYTFGLFVDLLGRPDTHVATLAELSADAHYRRIPGFVRASFATRKLEEFADNQVKLGQLVRPPNGRFATADILGLLDAPADEKREAFFRSRNAGLVEDSSGKDTVLDPEIQAVVDMQLGQFDTYIECLVAVRGKYHCKYITECLDSMMLKNRPGAMITQPAVKNGRRRFMLDSRLLEVLLQIAVLRPGGTLGYHTGEMRVDEVLTFLRTRYGIFIDRLPADGFGPASIADRGALRQNAAAFTNRLREIGFYRDLSDAYVTQTVSPRYEIGSGSAPTSSAAGGAG